MLQIKTEPESSSEAVQCQTCRAIIPHFKVVLQKKADFEFVFASRSILFPTKARITSFLDLSWQPTAEISNQSTVNSTMQAPRTSQKFPPRCHVLNGFEHPEDFHGHDTDMKCSFQLTLATSKNPARPSHRHYQKTP